MGEFCATEEGVQCFVSVYWALVLGAAERVWHRLSDAHVPPRDH
jgi:hypothetical protein